MAAASRSLLLLVVAVVALAAVASANPDCSCSGVTPTANQHCTSSISKIIVIRGYVSAIKSESDTSRYTITVREVFYNNAGSTLVYNSRMARSLALSLSFSLYISLTLSLSLSPRTAIFAYSTQASIGCGTFLLFHKEYYLRLHFKKNSDYTFTQCDYQELTAGSSTARLTLSCGNNLADCDRYPCPANSPCTNQRVTVCPMAICPQRVCATTTCTNVVCTSLALSLSLLPSLDLDLVSRFFRLVAGRPADHLPEPGAKRLLPYVRKRQHAHHLEPRGGRRRARCHDPRPVSHVRCVGGPSTPSTPPNQQINLAWPLCVSRVHSYS